VTPCSTAADYSCADATCILVFSLLLYQEYLLRLTMLDEDTLAELLGDSSVVDNGTNNSVDSDAEHVYSVTECKQQQDAGASSSTTHMPRPPHLKQVFSKLLGSSGKRSKQQPLTEAALNSSAHSSSVQQVVSPLHLRGFNSSSSSNMFGGSSSSNMFASRSFDSASDAVVATVPVPAAAAVAAAPAAPLPGTDAHADLLEIDIESGNKRSSSCDASADTAAAATTAPAAAAAQHSGTSLTASRGRTASRATPVTVTPLTVTPTHDVSSGVSPDEVRPVSPASSVATNAGATADQQVIDPTYACYCRFLAATTVYTCIYDSAAHDRAHS
jgi:hypothetical protein